MRIGKLRGFDVSVTFLHSQGQVNATKGGVDNVGGKKLNEDMKSM
jgi:hypothetical protein